MSKKNIIGVREYELKKFHSVILRKNGIGSKKAWDYICKKFGITEFESYRVQSIMVDSDVDGNVIITATFEGDSKYEI